MNQALFDYIAASPTAYHAVAHTEKILSAHGFLPLHEGELWTLRGGQGYYVTRNGSSLIAFYMPEGHYSGFMMTASHGDSPAFGIRENCDMSDASYLRLSCEKYGGMLCSTWMDRPLSVAGRVVVRHGDTVSVRLVDVASPCAVIPSVAIHHNRTANENASYNPVTDMAPLYAVQNAAKNLRTLIAEQLGESERELLSADLFLYNPTRGTAFNGMICAPRLDDLQCAFAALRGFLDAKRTDTVPVYCLFDNEEVGSQTKQGAASTFLLDTLRRICRDNETLCCKIANSFLVSCDNAHAIHPNHPEHTDKNHPVRLNCGIVIKHNANQRYTTDAVSAAVIRAVCEEAMVPTQNYVNRADMAGGSTLGNILNTQVSLNTVDIGLPQLAMHSCMETAGDADTAYLARALTVFYQKKLITRPDGSIELQ